MKITNIVAIIILGLVCFAGGFFGGMKFQDSRRVNLARQQIGNFFQSGDTRGQNSGNRPRMGNGARAVVGQILSIDEKSLTVKMPDGSTKIVLFGSSVVIAKSTDGTKSDLKTGENVRIFGSDNSDGSVTAQNIQIGSLNIGTPSGNRGL